MLALQEKWAEAERAYAEWVEEHPGDERGEAARYWRSFSLVELGREPEAEALAGVLGREARQEAWRGPAALLAASLRAARGDRAGAAADYAALAGAGWGAAVRPQALLGAARTAAGVEASRRFAQDLTRRYPDSPEAEAARDLLREPRKGGSRFGVQVGAYQKQANAAAERKRWARLKKPAVVVAREHAAFGRLYCVILGPFPSFDAAVRARDTARAGGATAQVTTY